MNNLTEAEIELKKISPPADRRAQVVYKATKGLFEFKKGNVSQGRILYREAMADAEEIGGRELFANAFMYLAMAEIESGTPEAADFAEAALRKSEKCDGASVLLTRQRLSERLAELNLKKEPLPFAEFHLPKILPKQ